MPVGHLYILEKNVYSCLLHILNCIVWGFLVLRASSSVLPLVTRAVHSRGASMWISLVEVYVPLVSVSRQALPYVEAAGCWLVGPDHQVAGCKTPGAGAVPES